MALHLMKSNFDVSAGVFETDCITKIYRQESRLPWCHDAARRETGCSSLGHKLPQKVIYTLL
jgi:hypothetical protein